MIPDAENLYLRGVRHELLSRDQELALARAIVDGEAALVAALAAPPSARAIFASAAIDLESGARRLDDVLRNPEREDAAAELQRALTVDALARVDVEVLGRLRLHPRFVGEIETQLRCTDRGALDTAAVAAARRAIDRAKASLVEHNLRLVVTIAMRYRRSGEPLVDLIQNGNLGLLRAVDKFDYRAGHRLTTYATWWIQQNIERGIAEHAPMIRVPMHLVEKVARVRRAERRFAAAATTTPSLAELAERTRLSAEKVAEVLDLPSATLSLDAPAGGEGDVALGDLVASDAFPRPDDEIAAGEARLHARELLASLSDRERFVLSLRYGIGDDTVWSLARIGTELSLTRERIRQIEREALEKLRKRTAEPQPPRRAPAAARPDPPRGARRARGRPRSARSLRRA